MIVILAAEAAAERIFVFMAAFVFLSVATYPFYSPLPIIGQEKESLSSNYATLGHGLAPRGALPVGADVAMINRKTRPGRRSG